MKLHSLSLRVALYGVLALGLIFTIGCFFLVRQTAETIGTQTQKLQLETAMSEARVVSGRLDVAAKTADDIVGSLVSLRQSNVTDRAAFDALLKSALERTPSILGTWVGFEPNALDNKDKDFAGKSDSDKTGRYVPYWVRAGGKIIRDNLVSYDDPKDGAYYQSPKALMRAVAIQPYIYEVDKQQVLMMSIGVPLIVDGKFIGTGGVDLRLDEINAALGAVKPFGDGFVSLVTDQGIAVAYPDPSVPGKSLKDAKETIDAAVADIAAAAIKSGKTEQLDAVGRDAAVWRYTAEPIHVGGTGETWSVVVAVPVATLEATSRDVNTVLIVLSAACVLVAGLMLFALLRLLVGGPLRALGRTVDHLAAGNYDADVAEARRKDEVGAIGQAIARFRDGLRQKMQAEVAADQYRSTLAASDRKQAMASLADEFEQAVGGIVQVVSSASQSMEVAARSLNTTAEDAAYRSAQVAGATQQAAGNVQTVAAASEELSSSIGEISRQVLQSSNVAAKAVEEANRTDQRIRGLENAAQKVGEVVSLIQAIAAQTNLLALNATIEAARAGDAGKGFAVVASEVKQLANQTAKATDDISAQIATIQEATRGSVEAIQSIGNIIGEMNGIARSIALSMEQQGDATQDISRNVAEVARGTESVAHNIAGVNAATRATGDAASEMLGTAGQLARQSEALGREVNAFLQRVRTA